MSYNQMLSEMIKKSGLTGKEIAERCKLHNVNIDPSYISKLQSAGQAPASDEVNRALAEACEADPEAFLYEAYMAKAPELVKQLIDNILDFIKMFVKMSITSQLPPELAKVAEDKIKTTPDYELIQMIINEDLTEMLGGLIDTITLKDMNDKDTKILLNPQFGLDMPDNSMEPLIPKGAKMQLDKADNIINGDIIVAVDAQGDYFIRRFVPVDKKKAVLIAENISLPPMPVTQKSLKLVGKVKSYSKEL